MQLMIIGAHQRVCPVEVREQLAFEPGRMQAALQALGAYTAEGFIISTCNRVELGGLVADGDGEQALLHFLANWHQLDLSSLRGHLYTYTGEEAARHLFQLAAGLDSMVLGEDQVMSQIKQAQAEAQAAGIAGQYIHRLLNSALAAGKLVRTRTDIARSHLSTVSVALDIARATFGGLAGRRVLLVGAGKIAELALKHLHGAQPAAIVVMNRTFERAHDLAAKYGVQAQPLAQLPAALCAADVVLSCTSAPDLVIDAAMVAAALPGRTAPLVLLDLAVPRDIDPAAAELPGVQLVGIDDMRTICDANRAARAGEIANAEALIAGEVAKFSAWWASQHVVPTIRALRERAETIRTAELERTLARMPNLSPQEQAAIGALSAAIINKLLHQPITTLKDQRDGDLAIAVQALFQLDTAGH